MNLSVRCAALLAAGCLLSAPARPQTAEPDTAVTNLIALAAQRLAYAEPVARAKQATGRPVDDPSRERALLARVATLAPRYGVDAGFAQTFFRDQIEANKQAQRTLLARWRSLPPAPASTPAPDLGATLRPALDRLTDLLLPALARVQPLRDAADCPARVSASLANWRRIADTQTVDTAALANALQHVCRSGGVGRTG